MIARKVAYNVIFNGISKVISLGIAFFSIGMLSRYLGTEDYGKYTTIFQYLALFVAFSDLGLYPLMTREISKKGVNENLIVNKVFTLRIIISLIIFVIFAILIPLLVFVGFLNYTKEIQLGILIIGISFLFSSSYGLLNGVFQKHLAMDKVALAELIGKVAQAVVIFLVVKFDKGLLFSLGYILCAMIINFILVNLFATKFIKLKFDWDFEYWKKFLKKSIPLGVGAIATFMYFKFDTLILKHFQNDDQVGVYGFAYRLIETLVFFPSMVIGLVFPLFSRYFKESADNLSKAVNNTFKFFIILTIPMVISVQFLADEVVTAIGGSEFLRSGNVLRILILALAFIFFGQLFTNLLIAARKQAILMKILIFMAIFNLSLNIIFIPIYSYMAAAWISVITELLVVVISLWALAKNNVYKINVPKVYLIVFAGIIMFCTYYFSPLHLYFNVVLAVAIYFLILFSSRAISSEEVRQLLLRK